VPHFNFASAEQLKAIVFGFKKVLDFYDLLYDQYALMVGTSEGEAKFLGYGQARALVDSWKKETNISIFLNADHHKSFESCKKAIDKGYGTVLIDASKMPFEENLKITHSVVDYAKSIDQDISVEGELGYLRGESKMQETVEIKPEDFTKPEEAKEFVEKTGVDRLAVVFGNIHGVVKEVIVTAPTSKGVGAPTKASGEEKLDFDLLGKISEAVPEAYLVLHGGSGLAEKDFKKAIENGIVNIHINTEIRMAYRQGLDEKLKESPTETTPYKFLEAAVEKMKEVVEQKTRIFLNL